MRGNDGHAVKMSAGTCRTFNLCGREEQQPAVEFGKELFVPPAAAVGGNQPRRVTTHAYKQPEHAGERETEGRERARI